MSGVEARELVPRELDEPYGFESDLAVLACLVDAAREAQRVAENSQIDWLMPEAADEKAFLERWVAALLDDVEE